MRRTPPTTIHTGIHGPTRPATARGFTLVEMLLALALLALMGSMAWLGMDALLRTQARVQEASHHNAALPIALGQWEADLQHAWTPPGTTPPHWDGQSLRLTRRWPASAADTIADTDAATNPQANAGLTVIAWAVRPGADGQNNAQWMRWQSAPVSTLAQWQQAWNAAGQWAKSRRADSHAATDMQSSQPGNGATAVMLMPASAMRIDFWHNGQWADQWITTPTATPATTPAATASSTSAAPAAQDGTASRSTNSLPGRRTNPPPTTTHTATQAATATHPGPLPRGMRLVLQTPQGSLEKIWANPATPVEHTP